MPLFPPFPIYLPWSDETRGHDHSFFECWVFKPVFHFPFSPSLRGSLVPPHFLPLWFTCISEVVDISPTVLIPACESSNPALHVTYSVCKLNKPCLVAVCLLSPLSCVQLFLTSWIAYENPWDCTGKNMGMGHHFLLQGTFWPRGRNSVSCSSCIAGRFFTTKPRGKSCGGS